MTLSKIFLFAKPVHDIIIIGRLLTELA